MSFETKIQTMEFNSRCFFAYLRLNIVEVCHLHQFCQLENRSYTVTFLYGRFLVESYPHFTFRVKKYIHNRAQIYYLHLNCIFQLH